MCDTAKKDYKLTPYDITVNTITQDKMFKGTITICIIYAVFAAILMIAAFISSNIHDLLFNRFLPFTMVYIIGTIIIIMLFSTYIMTFEPKKYKKINDFEYISCPDYWKLETQSEDAVKDIFDPSYPAKLFQYKCVMDDGIFNKAEIFNENNSSLNYRMSNNTFNLHASHGDSKPAASVADNIFKNYSSNNIHHLYRNINCNIIGLSCVKVVDDDPCDRTSDPINNFRFKLTSNALIMNNYKFINKDNEFIPLSNLTYPNTGLLTWSKTVSSHGVGTRVAAIALMRTTIVKWNDVYYTNLLNTFNENKLNKTNNDTGYLYVYTNDNTKYFIFGNLKVDTETKVITYIPCEPICFTWDGSNTAAVAAGGALLTANLVINGNMIPTNVYVQYSDVAIASTPSNDDASKFFSSPKITNGPSLQIYDPTKERPNIKNESATFTLGNANNIPLVCDQVYPLFLAYNEDENDNGNGNELRCAYSRICNVPWSDMHCD